VGRVGQNLTYVHTALARGLMELPVISAIKMYPLDFPAITQKYICTYIGLARSV